MNEEKISKGPAKGKSIITKLIKGAENACLEYIELSGSPFPGNAPESFIQAGAARALKKIDRTWVVLEAAVADTYKSSQPIQRGKTPKSVSKGRYDIVAYWNNGNPRAAIEVKSPVNVLSKQKFEKDFGRLVQTMNGHADASFQYGIFLFLTVKKSKGTDFKKSKIEIDKLVERLRSSANDVCPKKTTTKHKIRTCLHKGKFHQIDSGETQGAWRISAIVFQR